MSAKRRFGGGKIHLRGPALSGASLTALAFAAAPAAAQNASLVERIVANSSFATMSIGVGLALFASVTALAHVAGRRRWSQQEAALNADLAAARAKLDRAQVFLSTEPQIFVAWNSAASDPDIEGDLSLVLDAPAPRRLLGFGSWLAPDAAQTLDHCVERLRARGEGFRLSIASLNGRHLEAEGRAVGGRAVMRIRDVSGDRLELIRLRDRQANTLTELDALRTMLNAVPNPAWLRGDDNRILWANAAYARAVDARDASDAVLRGLELLDQPSRSTAAKTRQTGEIWRARAAATVAGERRLLDVVEAPAATGSVGIATDVSELEAARGDLERQMRAHGATLDQLSTAVAIFDRGKKLLFHNSAYRHLWGFDQAFLDSAPSDSEILDRLRAASRLPEEADYRGWKAALLAAYQSPETSERIWHLPGRSMLRVVISPNPQGGVTYLFDDVTDRYKLETQYNELSRVQNETLESLREGVAVFGTDGRLKLFNPAFVSIWKLDAQELDEKKPHVDVVARQCAPLSQADDWARMRAAVSGLHDQRTGFAARIERNDGVVLDCAAAPLPDGATLLTFSDVSATVRVERALTERNQALIDAEKLRNDFVHHVSYELRSPLTNIIGFVQLLSDGSVGPLNPKQREYANYVSKSSTALLAIINDILDLATVDKDAMQLDVGDVDIAATIRSAAEGVQDRLVEHDLRLQIVAMDGIGSFRADGKRVRQVLFNLLSNAIGFSAPQQTVTLAAMRRGDEIVFKVSDQGRGIPPDVLDKVFARFESHTIGSRHRGVGLGLSIVRSFVELHGGRVHIDSAPGEGTTVTCIFPAGAAAKPAETAKG